MVLVNIKKSIRYNDFLGHKLLTQAYRLWFPYHLNEGLTLSCRYESGKCQPFQ